MAYWWNDTAWEKPKYSDNNMSHCHLAHQNPTWIGLGLDLALYKEMVSFLVL
jgi:hypothetical protein